MTEFLKFQNALAQCVAKLVEDIESLTPKGKRVCGVTPLLQELPVVEVKEEMPFPYALIRIYTGATDEDENLNRWVVTAEIQFGVLVEDAEHQGHRVLLEMIERTANRFIYNHDLDHRYQALQDIEWVLQDSDVMTPPFYFGSVIIQFALPKQPREDKYC